MSLCAVILTALPVEYKAVRPHVTNPKEETHKGTIYEIGDFSAKGKTWRIAIAEIGPQNERASLETERAIEHFDPDVVLFVGVAGGIKDVTIGDVVAATKVYGYESGKADTEFRPRPEVYRPTYLMEQRARAVSKKEAWDDPGHKAFVAPTAAGAKVVSSNRSATFQFIKSNYGDSLAVEMEGLGFLAAVYANQDVNAMVVRGISDLIEGKVEADKKGSQVLASKNAAEFAFELLAGLDFHEMGALSASKIFNIPHPKNPMFTGRDSYFEELRKSLQSGEYTALTQAISGLGGIGKPS